MPEGTSLMAGPRGSIPNGTTGTPTTSTPAEGRSQNAGRGARSSQPASTPASRHSAPAPPASTNGTATPASGATGGPPTPTQNGTSSEGAGEKWMFCIVVWWNLTRYYRTLPFVFLINPLLGAAWPIVYFLQGRLGMAASFTRTYRFVCLAVVAKHLWCEQPVKEIQLTSICYVQICVYSSSYGDFLRWINRRPAAFADSTRSDRDIFVRITIALIFSSPMNGHC